MDMDKEDIKRLLTASEDEFADEITYSLIDISGSQSAVSYCVDISVVYYEICDSWRKIDPTLSQEEREKVIGFSDATFNRVRANYATMLGIFMPHRPASFRVHREEIFRFCCEMFEREDGFEFVNLYFPFSLGELQAKKLVNLAIDHGGFAFTVSPYLGEIVGGVFQTKTDIAETKKYEEEEKIRKRWEEQPTDPTFEINRFDHYTSRKD